MKILDDMQCLVLAPAKVVGYFAGHLAGYRWNGGWCKVSRRAGAEVTLVTTVVVQTPTEVNLKNV